LLLVSHTVTHTYSLIAMSEWEREGERIRIQKELKPESDPSSSMTSPRSSTGARPKSGQLVPPRLSSRDLHPRQIAAGSAPGQAANGCQGEGAAGQAAPTAVLAACWASVLCVRTCSAAHSPSRAVRWTLVQITASDTWYSYKRRRVSTKARPFGEIVDPINLQWNPEISKLARNG
jgi:hypothetical protein